MDESGKLYKIAQALNLEYNNWAAFGFIKNTYVLAHYEYYGKNASFITVKLSFPADPAGDDYKRFQDIEKKYENVSIRGEYNEHFNVKIDFRGTFSMPKTQTIAQVVREITNHFAQKYPDAKPRCSVQGCDSTENLNLYHKDQLPDLMCADCAAKLKQELMKKLEAEKNAPNNYWEGFFGALLFAMIPLLFNFFMLKLNDYVGGLAIGGAFCYLFASWGYSKCNGKLDGRGQLIVVATSLFCSVAVTVLGYMLEDGFYLNARSVKRAFDSVMNGVDGFGISLGVSLAGWFLQAIIMCAIDASNKENEEYYINELS